MNFSNITFKNQRNISFFLHFDRLLNSNNALRLAYGRQYDAIIVNLDLLVANNPVQNGRNLLQGQNMNVVMDEFAGNPLTISGIAITAPGTLTMAQAGSSWTTDQNFQSSATQPLRR